MNNGSAKPEQSPELVVSRLEPAHLRELAEAVARALEAEHEGRPLKIASPEAAERIIDRALRGVCLAWGNCDEGLYRRVLKMVDRSLLDAVLQRADGCQVRAAEILGISRNTLRAKMRENNLRSEDYT